MKELQNPEVRISDAELRAPGAPGIDVEIIDAEEIDYADVPSDRRLTHMSSFTRNAINKLFDGDVDEAAYEAERLFTQFANPPGWVIELHGAQRSGWKDWN